jgi:acyl carrier protein
MNLEPADLAEIIKACLREVADEEGFDLPEIKDETEIFGETGLLDSMALVSLVTGVEEAIDQKSGVTVSLADERAMSQSQSPYQTVATLAAYAHLRINEEPSDG